MGKIAKTQSLRTLQLPHQPRHRLRQRKSETGTLQIITVFENSVYSVSTSESAPAPNKQKTKNLIIETVIQEEATQPPFKETNSEMPVVCPPDPPIRSFPCSPPDYGSADYERERERLA